MKKVRPPASVQSSSEHLSAKEAAELLGVKLATLYAYVSRGVIRSTVQPGQRARRYYRDDVERASARMGGRAGIPETVETAVRWGQPMFVTAITELGEDGPRYRGHPAIGLAREGRSFESVAELLWTGLDQPMLAVWDEDEPAARLLQRIEAVAGELPPLSPPRVAVLANLLAGLVAPQRPDFERGSTITEARQLIRLHAAALGLSGPQRRIVRPIAGQSLAALIAAAWLGNAPRPAAVAALNAALVVCADHELSSATFAARVAASAGAELRACLDAAIVTQSGYRLGRGCDRAEALLVQARSLDDLKASVAGLAQSGRAVPGFNLVAYPKGDPRARYLLELAASTGERNAALDRLLELLAAAERDLALRPSLEVGLIALAMALRLPAGSASALWAVGRSAGWVAHVIEQRQAGFMLRPRAKFVAPV